ncbi:MAG TPA: hypothetical protein VMU50_23010 [Polyangia bacterium]|nr:hypothetical protein [Polyangia bacterium]
MATQTRKTPDWMIERLALGELDPATAAEVRRRLLDEGRSPEAEIAALAQSNRQLLAAHPVARVAAAVRERAQERRSNEQASRGATGRWRLGWQLGTPLVLGAAAVAIVFARPIQPNPTAATRGGPSATLEETGIKGSTTLQVYRHGRQGDERLADGTAATRGDLVQLAYRAGGGARFGALLSIDGAGQVTQHWPGANTDAAATLSAKGEVRLPTSYELDDAPGFERFFLITSDQPFPLSPVLEAARTLATRPAAARAQSLPLSASFHQESLILNKSRQETP